MSPEKRLAKAFELSNFSKKLFTHALHKRFPGLAGKKFQKIPKSLKKLFKNIIWSGNKLKIIKIYSEVTHDRTPIIGL